MTPTQRLRLHHLMNRLTDDLLSVLRGHRDEIEFAAREAFDQETEFASFAAFSAAAAITAHLTNDRGFCATQAREMTSIVMNIASQNVLVPISQVGDNTPSVH
jgi:hypothetical protein